MPPFVTRKRRLSALSYERPIPKKALRPTLFDSLDNTKTSLTVEDNKRLLESLDASDSESSLSEAGSSDFEDVFSTKRQGGVRPTDDEENMEWEDAVQAELATPIITGPGLSGDLELTLDNSTQLGTFTNPHDKKKGPTDIERTIRRATHCLHVQALMYHNHVRSRWANDKEVQKILLDELYRSSQMRDEVEKWRERAEKTADVRESPQDSVPRRKACKTYEDDSRGQRDLGRPVGQEAGKAHVSRSDPIIILMKFLAEYWRKKFRITAPSLRKHGYTSLGDLQKEIASFQKNKHNPEEHGERIAGLKGFRDCAKRFEGSRDLGVQLFTALLRGLGIEARMVASLQPVGFGWSKAEEAFAKKRTNASSKFKYTEKDEDSDENGDPELKVLCNAPKDKSAKLAKPGNAPRATNTTSGGTRRQGRGSKDAPIALSEESNLSEAPSSEDDGEGDDDLVIDVTLATPLRKPNMNYDRDIHYPNYWVEVISPTNHRVIPVEPMFLRPAVATKSKHLTAWEPRGTKADKAKQIFAYVVAYSPDGTAKDVTTRYLKNQMWPGRTKGFRATIEKVPITNRHGKAKGYVNIDWWKSVMSVYFRPPHMRTIVDDLEEAGELMPVKPQKNAKKGGEETLQGYKQSAEFVLERHLRREEALSPSAIPVKTFKSGKGEKVTEEPVYRREDVVACRTGESWHKEGRQVKAGEQPMKMVPTRAVTLIRKREIEETERETGEKALQGIYARDQTEWIVPAPIMDGIIPKNAFGNIDCFVPSMVPKGAVHVPLRGIVKICKRLGIDYAEAVVGFEFGNKRAVPCISGVVVAENRKDELQDAWEKDEEERKIKEEGKREKMALGMWRKFLMGLRIVERVREDYGVEEENGKEETNPFMNRNKVAPKDKSRNQDGLLHSTQLVDDSSGGFFREGSEGTAVEGKPRSPDDGGNSDTRGGFVTEDLPDEKPGSKSKRRSSPIYKFNQQFGEQSDSEEGVPLIVTTPATKRSYPRKTIVPETAKVSEVAPFNPRVSQVTRKGKPHRVSPTDESGMDSLFSPPNTDTEEAPTIPPPTRSGTRLRQRHETKRKHMTPTKSRYFERNESGDGIETHIEKPTVPVPEEEMPKRERGRPRKKG